MECVVRSFEPLLWRQQTFALASGWIYHLHAEIYTKQNEIQVDTHSCTPVGSQAIVEIV